MGAHRGLMGAHRGRVGAHRGRVGAHRPSARRKQKIFYLSQQIDYSIFFHSKK